MNSQLRNDVQNFLNTYYKFKKIELNDPQLLGLVGDVDIVDEEGGYWKSYKVAIVINNKNYPNDIPLVFELSSNIERDWDFHISQKGACCLDITHKLLRLKHRGIILIEFYKDVIYPFFANHQFRMAIGKYANGEYKHEEKGVIQFYEEEFGLTDTSIIIKLIEIALGKLKAERNKQCPVCGKSKFKKCCSPIVNQLLVFGKNQLEEDLKLFQEKLENISS